MKEPRIAADVAQKMKVPTIEDVIRHTAEHFGVPENTISETGFRARDAILKRQIAIYISRKITYKSINQIAEAFNQEHPGSVAYAVAKVGRLLLTEKELKKDMRANYNVYALDIFKHERDAQ